MANEWRKKHGITNLMSRKERKYKIKEEQK